MTSVIKKTGLPQIDMLFSAVTQGAISFRNRAVMFPMTRSRAASGNSPNAALMAEYRGRRVTAGLIVTEGTSPSPDRLGCVPGFLVGNGLYFGKDRLRDVEEEILSQQHQAVRTKTSAVRPGERHGKPGSVA